MSLSLANSVHPSLQKSLYDAIDLGLITSDQAQSLCDQHNPEEILLILEQIASDQITAGRQCVGDQCQI